MMIGRPELCFWRFFALCSVLVCVANIFVLIGAGNFKVKEHILTSLPSARSPVTGIPPRETFDQPQGASLKNRTIKVHQNVPTPATKDINQVTVKNPLWLPVINLEKFFSPEKILVLGRRRPEKAYVVIGIPTVHRTKVYYLTDTVKWLVNHLPIHEHRRVVIVVFVADLDHGYRDKVVSDMKRKFPSAVEDGLLQVIQTLPEYYPNLNNLPRLYGDKTERVKWRSKQSLDYSFMYYYCANLAEFYIQLEDDVMAVPDYFSKIETFLEQRRHQDWSTIEFGARGFIGMTYRTKYLLSLARFSRFYFWTMPIDWIFRIFNDIFLFGNSRRNVLSPPVFKHIGEYSSLDGQRRKLEDLKNKKEKEKKDVLPHIYQPKIGNPPATVTTTITQFVQGHEIGKAYSNNGYFWGKTISPGLYIEIVLKHPTILSRIVIPSGSPLYPADSFEDTGLSVTKEPYVGQCKGFQEVGRFVDTPVIDYTFNDATPSVHCVRLTINKVRKDTHGRPRWLIIREIALL